MSAPAPRSPAEAYAALVTGNRRFVENASTHPRQDADHRVNLAAGQRPFAVVLGCSDSRLAPEIVFDQGLGDLFVARTAGHVGGPEVLGSIEYGVTELGAPLVVVLGHGSCGAVSAAVTACSEGTGASGYISDVVEQVLPSVRAARAAGLTGIDDVVDEHVDRTVRSVVRRSSALTERIEAGRCAVAGLSYRLTEGSVRLVTSHGEFGG